MRGRPRKFQSVEELEELIEAYFEHCNNSPHEIPSVCGLAVALGTDRSTLLAYENEYEPEFSYPIKAAKARCEHAVEQQLFFGKNAAGPIFNLKNNFKGWVDARENTHKGPDGGPVTVIERRIVKADDPNG